MAATLTYHANVAGTSNRASGNPAGTAPYTTALSTGLNRKHLFIQNKGPVSIELNLSSSGSTISLFSGSSISIDNYNGGFSVSDYSYVSIQEAFAE